MLHYIHDIPSGEPLFTLKYLYGNAELEYNR